MTWSPGTGVVFGQKYSLSCPTTTIGLAQTGSRAISLVKPTVRCLRVRLRLLGRALATTFRLLLPLLQNSNLRDILPVKGPTT